MQRWSFYTFNGDKLEEGWPGSVADARARAQDYANQYNAPVSYTDTDHWTSADGEPFMKPVNIDTRTTSK